MLSNRDVNNNNNNIDDQTEDTDDASTNADGLGNNIILFSNKPFMKFISRFDMRKGTMTGSPNSAKSRGAAVVMSAPSSPSIVYRILFLVAGELLFLIIDRSNVFCSVDECVFER